MDCRAFCVEKVPVVPEESFTVVWSWEARDPERRRGWRRLSWKMSEETAAQWARTNQTEVRQVDGSREERRDIQGWSTIKPGTPLHFYDKRR